MANKLDPTDLKQIITLQLDGPSNRQTGKQLGIGRNTVNRHTRQFKASGKSLNQLLHLDNAALEALFPSATTIKNNRYAQLMRFFVPAAQQGLPAGTVGRCLELPPGP